MKTVGVRMEWVGEAEEVAVAGEFNGWVTVPLNKEKVRIGSFYDISRPLNFCTFGYSQTCLLFVI